MVRKTLEEQVRRMRVVSDGDEDGEINTGGEERWSRKGGEDKDDTVLKRPVEEDKKKRNERYRVRQCEREGDGMRE